ncbi:hypothetical protein WOLCODRAFT_157345 [Wolfiporia cocos MD-104 SS10]|uniref:Uncharacterized protein n=1 Tax=Wolfiporia cocos (strain MD-104) TaxID=742152 RepID=A0A2H3J331_WOLCO|nr:hypothetical protein WOLCODRAFT_157345 [Wolfiporia cocos MD-104 SS10]
MPEEVQVQAKRYKGNGQDGDADGNMTEPKSTNLPSTSQKCTYLEGELHAVKKQKTFKVMEKNLHKTLIGR